MKKTLKVNVVGYIFPPERMCHRLRACSGFRCITKFGTGVAFKISTDIIAYAVSEDRREAGSVPLSLSEELIYEISLNLGGTTMLSSLADGSFFNAVM
ncbi:hypothetical protein I5677_04630 [Mobilitalea sibirica]|uniref:Uncharacterized protein n=1 Tax=Mobilitalea sibirica TaxID=1462919 RepID=A0A8J7KVH6_9FIRM|nr:hypothetical protein [Mobilitalea sibirica]MBH1940180.1 hypothetical protein [Mobilitalea sibirica]